MKKDRVWIRFFRNGYKEVSLKQQGFNSTPMGYQDAEYIRADIAQAQIGQAKADLNAAIKRVAVLEMSLRPFADDNLMGLPHHVFVTVDKLLCHAARAALIGGEA